MNRIIAAVVLMGFGFASQGQSAQEKFLAKMLKKASEVDESMVQPMEMFLDGGAQATSEVADGTKTMKFKCAISDQSKKIKKGYNQKQHAYKFVLKVTSAAIDQEMVDKEIFSKQGKISEWSEAGGSLEFELGQIEILRHLDPSTSGEKYEMEATLITASTSGGTLLSKGQFSVSSNPNGKWVNESKEDWIESYKTGRLAESNTSAPVWKRMLAYTKNKWPGVDIIHLKVNGSSITNDNRLNTEIFVTYTKGGVCTYAAVGVWEDRYQLTLDNYVPQYSSNPDCGRLEEIRNVR